MIPNPFILVSQILEPVLCVAVAAVVLIAALLLLEGCTTIYGPDGKPRLRSGDVQHVAYTHAADGSESLTADAMTPSTVITAAGKAATPAVMAVGGAVMMNGTTKVVDAVRKPVP